MFDQVYLTGFKVFGNHQVNPTQLIAEHFAKANIPGLKSAIVEVTTKDVDSYIDQLKPIVNGNKEKKILNIHFGVGPNEVYKLERCCYNNKDFGIADNLGYKPTKEKICCNQALDHPLYSKLDVQEINKILGKQFPMKLSTDPGRYLCNYIYFKSSHDLAVQNEHVYSFFVHFPVLELSPHEKNIKFVERLLELLLKKQQHKKQHKKEHLQKQHLHKQELKKE